MMSMEYKDASIHSFPEAAQGGYILPIMQETWIYTLVKYKLLREISEDQVLSVKNILLIKTTKLKRNKVEKQSYPEVSVSYK